MTFGSFVVIALQNKLSKEREEVTKSTFSLPKNFKPLLFIRNVIIFTLICEILGAGFLYVLFLQDPNVTAPLWNAIFHSISAFCTAGFSLFSDSFEAYKLNIVIAALSYMGAIGFLVMSDMWFTCRNKKPYMFFTSKLVIKVTVLFALFGTLFIYTLEPSIQDYEPWQRLLTAFFQIMTATTTVGFNTVPIGGLAPVVIMFMYFVMVFGASPSGTGGGLKSTTLATLIGLVRSVIKRRNSVRLMKRNISSETLNLATASFVFYMFTFFCAMLLLLGTQTLTDTMSVEAIMFEVTSALGTVGLSMGIIGDLTPLGKLIIMMLMFMGRVGILTFGIAISMRDETVREEKDNEILI